jgi:hypothetical protein
MKPIQQLIKLFIISLTIIGCGEKEAPKLDVLTTHSNETIHFDFPDDWIGHWQGQLEIWSTDSILQKIPMFLQISENDSCVNWNITYGADKSDNRQYLLKTTDRKNGHYQMDELNGIVLDVWKKGNSLTSAFELNSQLLIVSEEISEQGINFEVKVVDRKNNSVTGESNTEIDLIYNYPLVSYQKALLTRNK